MSMKNRAWIILAVTLASIFILCASGPAAAAPGAHVDACVKWTRIGADDPGWQGMAGTG